MHLLYSESFAPGQPVPKIAELLRTINRSQLQQWVERIAVPRHFIAEAKANRDVGEFLAVTLRDFGYETSIEGDSRNVIALPPDIEGPAILVGAHYDSIPDCPGADDNASAVAAMLACASACSLWRPRLPVMFVAFNREEEGLLGSREFVEEWLPGKAAIAGAHILEMLGFASETEGSQRLPAGLPIKLPSVGNFLGLLANTASTHLLKSAIQHGRTYAPALPVIGLETMPGMEKVFPVLGRSDHLPFWVQGVPAMMWTDTAEFRNPNYHQPSDTPETLNYPFLEQAAKILTATALESAIAMESH